MGFKLIISLISIFFLSVLIFFYFVPIKTINFGTNYGNGNFSSSSETTGGMQFYSNMRFSEPNISYKILNCPLQKQNDMQLAFDVMGNSTSLRFYPVDSGEEISVTCEDKEQLNGNLFIAGEGGPTNVTAIGNFAVILNGEILLIRESKCPKPNIALHELLHVLGFQHSTNPQNIMYNVTNCEQVIGDDTIQLINKLYLTPSYPDLAFKNASATMNGRFLNVEFGVMNAGLKDAGAFKVKIYADKEMVKEIEMEPLNIGFLRFMSLNNIWISSVNVKELELDIESGFNEIDKENNKIKLQVS
jgi:hypothetical protein